MSEKLLNLLDAVLKESVFLKSIESLKGSTGASKLFGDNVRKLRDEEINQLITQGNVSDDWEALLVVDDFTPSRLFHSSFYGKCCLGRCEGTGGTEISDLLHLPAGIYRSTIVNTEIGNGCVIHDAGTVSNCIVDDEAVLLNNGSVSAAGSCVFGNGISIPVGNETGGREVLSFAELTVALAEAVAVRRSDKKFLSAYGEFIKQYITRCTLSSGYIGKKAVIRNTGTVEDTCIGEGAAVIGAALIRNSTLLATPGERTEISHGAYVVDSCIQWGSKVTSMAIVDRSVLCEHSHVERHGKVTSSIIGPNTGVAEGEVTSCLIGPFVGFHHQAMLIAGIWPEGKGNVAYGANVGSNHTSKAPDQEIFCGEGMFFGLGVNIKFPSDFSRSPYSIIATGVTTLPQKIDYPFCLLNSPSSLEPGVPPSYNEIFPGWVLSQNIYSVRRNEGKYKKRNKARRSEFVFTVFRPDVIDLMITARNYLKNVKKKREIYTNRDIPGIGKNYLTEKNRKAGIDAYVFYIEYYALSRLLDRICAMQAEGSGAFNDIYDKKTDDREWEHARGVLMSEGYGDRSVRENLLRLIDMVNRISTNTFRSKERDDGRGKRIIQDYPEVTILAGDDSFVKETAEKTAELTGRIEGILAGMK